jgi:hypothetical protein
MDTISKTTSTPKSNGMKKDNKQHKMPNKEKPDINPIAMESFFRGSMNFNRAYQPEKDMNKALNSNNSIIIKVNHVWLLPDIFCKCNQI